MTELLQNSTRGATTAAASTSPWMNKRRVGRRKVSRSIAGRQVRDLDAAWDFARSLGLPMNRMLSIRPRGIDSVPAVDRPLFWSRFRNKLAQFARDNGFEFVSAWSRESDEDTGQSEHLHVLMHVPAGHQKRFDGRMEAWSAVLEDEHVGGSEGGNDGSNVIECRPADYRTRWTNQGKKRNAMTYLTKNSPQAAHSGRRSYQKGGPILGKRSGMTRNLSFVARQAQAAAKAFELKRRLLANGAVPTCTPLIGELRNYGAIIAERPVVTSEMGSPKMPNNSNFKTEKKGAA